MIIFHKNTTLKKATFLLIFFFGIQFLYAKNGFKEFYNHPEYDKVIEDCNSLLKTKELKKYELGLEKLNALEKSLINQKDFKNLGVFYLNTSSIYYTNSDLVSTLKYLDKGMLVLKRHPNNEIMGFYYENYAVTNTLLGRYYLGKGYLLKSKVYLEKYAPIETRADLYYNLCVTSVRDKEWENVVKYGNLNSI